MADFSDLKVGDRVHRVMGSGGPRMVMQVAEVREDVIVCAAVQQRDGHEVVVPLGWTFDRKTGVEEDEDLQWGVSFGQTGTYLERM